MTTYIEKRRNLWYATLKVPPALQVKVGRAKFLKSTGTADKRKAEDIARPYIVLWKKMLREAEHGTTSPLIEEAKAWREDLQQEYPDEETAFFATEAKELGLIDRAKELEKEHGDEKATQFFRVALGTATLTNEHVNAWESSIIDLEQKTQDQMKKDVKRLVERFPTVEGITPASVRDWVKALTSGTEPLSHASIKRMGGAWRSFWNHLVGAEVAPEGPTPFANVERHAPTLRIRKGQVKGWIPFPAHAIPGLVQAARDRKDPELVQAIILGAYTGARIEELCSLKTVDVGEESFHIRDAKTQAGLREVPIHKAIRPLVKQLKEASTDGFLISGLTLNKYNDRSNALGKRFGRLKTKLKYSENHVFHSLRKTLVTLLEDAGVSENLAADIVGHEKPRITYGLYSDGASLKTKAEALALVSYPGLVLDPA